jgi:CheY-like chemotaxis protein
VRLVHWNAAEAQQRIDELSRAGFQVDFDVPTPSALRALRADPPDAIVVDLTRSPSQGRDVAAWVRSHASTRTIPLVFVEGAPDKIAQVRRLLPDVPHTTWGTIGPAVRRAIEAPPIHPVRVASALAGYSGTPLPKKLGIKEGMRVLTVGAPPNFASTLGALPLGASLREDAKAAAELVIWFVRSAQELERRIVTIAARARSGLWIAWLKQASGIATDVTQTLVRETGLAHGLVDYKIAAIDPTWSGLKFAHRKPAKPVKKAARRGKKR